MRHAHAYLSPCHSRSCAAASSTWCFTFRIAAPQRQPAPSRDSQPKSPHTQTPPEKRGDQRSSPTHEATLLTRASKQHNGHNETSERRERQETREARGKKREKQWALQASIVVSRSSLADRAPGAYLVSPRSSLFSFLYTDSGLD